MRLGAYPAYLPSIAVHGPRLTGYVAHDRAPHHPRVMSDTSLATFDPSTVAPSDLPTAHRVTGKVRTALDAMIWGALPRREAAAKAGISEHGLYKALRKPPVRAYYLAGLDVLRTSERARNIHTLAEVRDQTSNQMARVAAVKALEQLDDQPANAAARAISPGFIIQVITPSASAALMPHQPHIEAKPLISLDTVRPDD